MTTEKRTLLVIPAYNEDMNIGIVLDTLRDAGVFGQMDVLVINDGSADRTAEEAEAHGAKVLSQCFNMGYGAALQTAYKYAEKYGYDYLLQMDADGQHDVCNLRRMSDSLGITAEPEPGKRVPDIVIGSRFLDETTTFRITGLKKFAIGMFNGIILRVTGYHLTDPTSGLQGLNRKAFCFYAQYGQFDLTYPDLNMILQMLLLGYHIEEVPAKMHERMAGVSMHSGLLKAGRYMIVMMLSTAAAILRYGRKDRK